MKIERLKYSTRKNSKTLRLFDIAELSVYDGPGVRSVVYFQGCPLQCDWCHSPQSQPILSPLMFSPQLCMLCGRCVEVCENSVHSIVNGEHLLDRNRCTQCGDCIRACPSSWEGVRGSALHLPTVVTHVDEVYEQVKPYLELTKESGGVTLSGGEPMMQLDAALELLKRCKEDGFHTALETSGLMPIEKYRLLLPWVDLWLWGMRITTGELPPSKIEIIDRNLTFMVHHKAQILPRIPMIPGVMNSSDVLEPMIELLSKHDLKKVELNPWNRNYDVNYINSGMALRKQPPSEDEILRASETIQKRFIQLKFTIDGNNV